MESEAVSPEPLMLNVSSDDIVLDAQIPPMPEDSEESPLFFIDIEPSPISLSHIVSTATPLGADDDDIIVYDAPLPRSRASTPHETNRLVFTPVPSITKELEQRQKARAVGSFVTPHKTDSIILAPGPSTTKKTVLRRRHKIEKRRKKRAVGSFADRAADVAEAQLYEQNARDPQHDERRQGDSDLDWGDSDADEVAEGVDGMEVDPELELDVEGMKRFAQGMSGEWKSMDDIADEARMKQEDEDEDDDTSSDDSEDDKDVTQAVEQDEDDMLGESDEDYTPDSSFQARLQALRLGSKGKGKERADRDDEDSDEDYFKRNKSWAEGDDDFAYLEDILQAAADEDRGERKRIFKAVQNGDFDEEESTKPARRKKDKYKDLPPDLRVQWAKDREKKAERKREREMERLIQAADPLTENKGGKKGRKAMLAAAGLDPTIVVIPNRIIDPTTLVQQIRRFIADLNSSGSMTLPPTNKETRKNVHLLAIAFGLKSVSKGKGDARYTTLAKTTRSGVGRVDEKKVAQVMRMMSARGGAGADWTDYAGSGRGQGKGKGTVHMPRHKEGDEVGKEAPKIGQSNIGFKMLASMGWSEGTHIGVAEERALKDPLTAVIKNTKLGLGATK
ncbi:hypothetical protein BDZ89DRAFT_1126784 [Hymenopellis radicata]|nr:hypothetical protein BDZ89DRAFT_1126784 [Hymenopellis radicata]